MAKSGSKATVITSGTSTEDFEALSNAAIDAWFDGPPIKSCALDESADEHTLEEVAGALCMTRERVRQIEVVAKRRLVRGVRAIGEDRGRRQ